MSTTVNPDTLVVKLAVPLVIGGAVGAITKTHEPEEEAPFKERLVFDLVVSTIVTVVSSVAVQATVSWMNKNRR